MWSLLFDVDFVGLATLAHDESAGILWLVLVLFCLLVLFALESFQPEISLLRLAIAFFALEED